MFVFVFCFVGYFGVVFQKKMSEKKNDYELVANEIWSKVNHGSISSFIKFDEFRRFWFIVRDKQHWGSKEVCV